MTYISLEQINSNPIFAPVHKKYAKRFLKRIKNEMEKQFGFIDDDTLDTYKQRGDRLKYFYHEDPDLDMDVYALHIEGDRFTYKIIKTNKNKCELIRICNINVNKRKHYKNYTKSRIIEDMRLRRCGFLDFSKTNPSENWDGKHKTNKEVDKDRISYLVRVSA